MGRRRKVRRIGKNKPRSLIAIDYQSRVFMRLHAELEDECPHDASPHPIRERFWSLVQTGTYPPFAARPLLEAYSRAVTDEIRSVVSQHSLAYWLHVYRRLFPGPIGVSTAPWTVGITRAIMEAAFQKYAVPDLCHRVGVTPDISVAQILRGELLKPGYEPARQMVNDSPPALYLTEFGLPELKELYAMERLAYELWLVGAIRRTLAKGGELVTDGAARVLTTARTEELSLLIQSYDKRLGGMPYVSASGVVFSSKHKDNDGTIFLPTYNLGQIPSDDLRELFLRVCSTNLKVLNKGPFNFVWLPLDMRDYLVAHRPYSNAFRERHHVTLESVLLVVTTISVRAVYSWFQSGAGALLSHMQRAYEGPCRLETFTDDLLQFRSAALHRLGLHEDDVSENDFLAGVEFWSLTSNKREDVDLSYPGPHHIFLPCSLGRHFVDYAWILRRLHDLFWDIHLNDENFKGAALETLVRQSGSALPKGPCFGTDGTSRQIDAAFPVGKTLVVAECRVVGRSIACDRGDPYAANLRRDRAVEKTIGDIDEKALWLSDHVRGTNYSLDAYDQVLPVGVSPFVEFIPSEARRYWVDDETPRLLTPAELRELIQNPAKVSAAQNLVRLRRN